MDAESRMRKRSETKRNVEQPRIENNAGLTMAEQIRKHKNIGSTIVKGMVEISNGAWK